MVHSRSCRLCLDVVKPGFHSNVRNARNALRKEKYASKIKKVRNKRKKITQAKKKSTQAQVTQLTQAVFAQENATIESILFFTQRSVWMETAL